MIFKNSTIPTVKKIIKKNTKNKFEKNMVIMDKSNAIEVKSLFLNSGLI